MLKSKIAMAMAAAMVLATLYGCSSSGIRQDRDEAKEALQAAIEAHAAALEAAETAKTEALAAAATAAETAKTEALAAAATAAETAKTEALAAAATAAETAKMMALAAAAMAADAAQMEALAAAAMAADAAQMEALAAAAMAADAAQMEALAAAANLQGEELAAAIAAAETAKMMALAEAATAADAAKMTALAEAATAADAAKMTALAEAATAADAAKMTALAEAATAADAAKMMALAEAATAADAAKMMALAEAATAAEEAQRLAVATAVATALGEAGVESALDAYDRANVALGTARTEYDSDTSSVDKANAYKKYADAALVAAQSAKAVADAAGNAAQMGAADRALDAATGAVRGAGEAVTFAMDTTMTTEDAIAVAMAITADPGTAGPFDAAENNNTIAVTYEDSDDGVVFTVTDVKGNDDVEVAADGDPVMVSLRLHKSVHTSENEDDTTSEMTVVYSDIAAPGPQAYEDYYSTVRTGVTGIVSDTDGVLNLDEDMVAAAAELYSSPNFPQSGDQIKTYKTADDLDTDVDESAESMFAGTFNGIPGMYSCENNNQDCGATADKEGKLMTLTGMWEFTPTDFAAGDYMLLGVLPDTDHLYYGYWLKTEVTDDGNEYEFQAFSGGSMVFAESAIAAVEGKATYNGTAAGRYVEKSDFDQAGSGRVAVTGAFTARANLTANFDAGGAVAVADHYSISGTVSHFVDETNQSLDSLSGDGWTVKLQKATFGVRNDVDGTVTSPTNDWTGVAEGTGNDGTWSGQFFGDSADDAQPSGVAGEFTAHFTNGHVAGAFGAARE